MNIIADENIPYVQAAFAHLGEVETLSGRHINNKNLNDADILLVRSVTQVNQKLLENTKVKFVATATSGINHIDTQYLQSNNIGFASALGSNAMSVAQYVISAICYWSIQAQKPLDELTLGIIGYGNVGSRLKQLCDYLNIKTVINDPPLQQSNNQKLVSFSSIQQALNCDIVSLHVPLTTDGIYPTNKLFNLDHISKLKAGGLFINTSRGEVVDEAELFTYCQNNQISVVLDVWQNEPNISLTYLKQSLIGTPHIAGYSFDAKTRGTEMIYQACCRHLKVATAWSAKNIHLTGSNMTVINQSIAKDIRKMLLSAYNIKSDDKQLKKILKSRQLPLANYFDDLRKDYPIRREWVFI
jgi:erythronate-4-phosphate dehydrogenase